MSQELEEGSELRLDWDKLKRIGDLDAGVLPAVVQDADSGEVLILAYANEEALNASLKTGRAVFWSTSREELWRKGESSGNALELLEVRVNCEQNSLLYRVRPCGEGSCHTRDQKGRYRTSCYYRKIEQPDRLVFLPPAGG